MPNWKINKTAEELFELPLSSEAERMQKLHGLNILGRQASPQVSDLVECTARFFRTPVGFFSVLDEDTQHLYSRFGVSLKQTPRDIAFCDHTIKARTPMIIDNAAEDERFRHNPLVTQAPSIRFYAGAPVIIDNWFAIGSLCIVDTKPRSLTPNNVRMLGHFASILSVILEHEFQLPNRLLDGMRHVRGKVD
ncbi:MULTISPECIES: GAF domain-containing protein [Henriciella]|jgi:GAF domain-containing protein|uniref:GAF domain-containing protein n=1 Tax=Henriciella pelagia TaxID=1977912 RepID=A0ABQ1JYZ9_9PROT|nr:GAF domain-containing protein [Henriciella pelagia]GGB81256.1 hypothetical protein GCM10011503_32550 [Henriciella pelagia]